MGCSHMAAAAVIEVRRSEEEEAAKDLILHHHHQNQGLMLVQSQYWSQQSMVTRPISCHGKRKMQSLIKSRLEQKRERKKKKTLQFHCFGCRIKILSSNLGLSSLNEGPLPVESGEVRPKPRPEDCEMGESVFSVVAKGGVAQGARKASPGDPGAGEEKEEDELLLLHEEVTS